MNKPITHYIIQTASANMPQSCWGRYARIGLLEVEAGYDRVSMISERATGVVRVVETWEKLNVGKTDRCAFGKAMVEAEEMCVELNNA